MFSSEAYYAAVERILRPTDRIGVWFGRKDGLPYNVSDPSKLTAQERVEARRRISRPS